MMIYLILLHKHFHVGMDSVINVHTEIILIARSYPDKINSDFLLSLQFCTILNNQYSKIKDLSCLIIGFLLLSNFSY